MKITLAFPERQLLDEIADRTMKQEDVWLSYALALDTPDEVDWPKVNRAIVERWSHAGLRRIKDNAWRLRSKQAEAI